MIDDAFAHSGLKRNRVTISEQCLDIYKRNPSKFLQCFITVDETWIHHYTPEMKRNGQNSEFLLANVLQRREKRFHRLES